MNEKVWDCLGGKEFISSMRGGNDLYTMTDDRAQTEVVLKYGDHGGNKLINVGMNLLWPSMFHHYPTRERVFLLSSRDTKPLYIASTLSELADSVREWNRGELKKPDLMIVEILYDRPGFNCFATSPGVLRGEFTCPEERANPVLVVTELSGMTTNLVDTSDVEDMFMDAVRRTREAV